MTAAFARGVRAFLTLLLDCASAFCSEGVSVPLLVLDLEAVLVADAESRDFFFLGCACGFALDLPTRSDAALILVLGLGLVSVALKALLALLGVLLT